MDLELRRCRRTDGKKWRCRREVVSNEKYCDRHMHRGCARSRKLVEASEKATKPDTANLTTLVKEGNSHTKLSAIRFPNDATNNYVRIKFVEEEHQVGKVNSATIQPEEHAALKFLFNVTGKSDVGCTVKSNGNVEGSRHCIKSQNDGGRNSKNDNKNVAVSASLGLDFIRKSDLCGDSSLQNLKQASTIESEPGRCSRTDGKKWRCRKSVLPEQKYCETHIHRGSKKRVLPSRIAISSAAASTAHAGIAGPAKEQQVLQTSRCVLTEPTDDEEIAKSISGGRSTDATSSGTDCSAAEMTSGDSDLSP